MSTLFAADWVVPVSSRVHELPPADLPPAAEAPEPAVAAEPAVAPAGSDKPSDAS